MGDIGTILIALAGTFMLACLGIFLLKAAFDD